MAACNLFTDAKLLSQNISNILWWKRKLEGELQKRKHDDVSSQSFCLERISQKKKKIILFYPICLNCIINKFAKYLKFPNKWFK